MEENNEIFKNNIIALFKLFDNSYHVLSNYMIEHGAFTTSFQEKVIANKKLIDLAKDDNPKPPHFKDHKEMTNYYSDLFTAPYEIIEPKSIPFKDDAEALSKQLKDALDKEDYLRAAKIRDYAKEKKINLL